MCQLWTPKADTVVQPIAWFPPEGKSLYPYQQEAVRYMTDTEQTFSGGMLCLDMGMGKTGICDVAKLY